MTINRHVLSNGSRRGVQSFRQSRSQGEAEERNVRGTFRRPNADIARAVQAGRRNL
jgi:hypothetical protein